MVGHNGNVECPMVPLVGRTLGWMVGMGIWLVSGIGVPRSVLVLGLALALALLVLALPALGLLARRL